MEQRVAKKGFLKLLALFTLIRGYNIAALVLAMYLTAYFIFSKDTTLSEFFSEYNLHLIVLASAFTVAAGYIINNFYDLDKDRISRPISTYISKYVNQNFKLNVYLFFNAAGLSLAFLASWRIGIFFFFYQFLVWFYCHKLSRITFINNLFYVILSMLPFLALLLYYNNYHLIIFFHALFLGLLLLSLDITKDFVSYKGDVIYDYRTLPVTIGFQRTKIVLTSLLGLNLLWTLVMAQMEELGHMRYYFFLSAFFLLLLMITIWFINQKYQYNLMYLALKLMLGIGIISIAWIKINPLALQKFFPVN